MVCSSILSSFLFFLNFIIILFVSPFEFLYYVLICAGMVWNNDWDHRLIFTIQVILIELIVARSSIFTSDFWYTIEDNHALRKACRFEIMGRDNIVPATTYYYSFIYQCSYYLCASACWACWACLPFFLASCYNIL